jgi:hypothetical protein
VSDGRDRCALMNLRVDLVVEALCALLFLLSLDVGVLPVNQPYFFLLLL